MNERKFFKHVNQSSELKKRIEILYFLTVSYQDKQVLCLEKPGYGPNFSDIKPGEKKFLFSFLILKTGVSNIFSSTCSYGGMGWITGTVT